MPQSARRFGGASLPFLLLCAALLAPAIAFVVLHVVAPSDGAHMDPTVDSWRQDGIVLAPLDPGTSPLWAGDILVAVEGQSLETWAQQLPRVNRPPRPGWAQPPFDPSVLEGCAERVAHLSQLLHARSRRSR